MLSHDIKMHAAALGCLIHKLNEEDSALLRIIKSNLLSLSDDADEIERALIISGPSKPIRITPEGPASTAALERKREKVRQQLDAFWDKQEVAEGC